MTNMFISNLGDIRFHLSSRRVAPFIKFDIGYNILLSEKSMPVYMPDYYGTTPYTFKITGGGVYFSTGLGFRIAVNKLLQIITSVDYSIESTNRMVIKQTATPKSYPEKHTALKYFTFNIGIGFQKK